MNLELIEVEEFSNNVVCKECNVCPDPVYYEVLVDKSLVEKLKTEGCE